MQCGRERAREMIVIGFVLLIAGAHATALREARADAASAPLLRLRGDHAVLAPATAADVELALKSGFSVLLHGRRGARANLGLLGLRVAKRRAAAVEIDPGFVPIGPTVELTSAAGRADVAFAADQFRVRRGQRLVLAVEQAACAAPACNRWRLEPASYEAGRCVARGIAPAGLRLQFGSLAQE